MSEFERQQLKLLRRELGLLDDEQDSIARPDIQARRLAA
jgi:hypothetical protein